jgi:hypothetical protein
MSWCAKTACAPGRPRDALQLFADGGETVSINIISNGCTARPRQACGRMKKLTSDAFEFGIKATFTRTVAEGSFMTKVFSYSQI